MKKTIAGLMVVLSLVFIFPQSARAQYVDIVQSLKELGLDTLAYQAANMMIKKVTAQTVNWINSGFKGNPAYITNPGQFFLDIGDNTASRILSGIGPLNNLCSPFKAQVRLALVQNYLNDTTNGNFSCSLGQIAQNYDNFTRDFNQGGWDAWFNVSQNNQSNPYGAYLDAKDTLKTQIGIGNLKYQQQLDWGKGVFSWQSCPESARATQQSLVEMSGWSWADIQAAGGPEAVGLPAIGDCFDEQKQTDTPGTVIENQLNKVLGSGTDRIVAADEVSEIISALMNQLIGRVVGGIAGGLRGASAPATGGGASYTSQVDNEPITQPDYPNGMPAPPVEPVPVYVVGGQLGGTPSGPPGEIPPECQVSLIDDVIRERAAFGPTLTSKDQNSTILLNVAQAHADEGWGVLSKTSGNRCPSPSGDISCDILVYKPCCLYFDVLGGSDVGDLGTPQFNLACPVPADMTGFIGTYAGASTCVTPTYPSCGSTGGGGGGGGGTTDRPPADASTRHPNADQYVDNAKAWVIANFGYTYTPATADCPYRYAIIERTVADLNASGNPLYAGAGFLSSSSGGSCNGRASDIIMFPDGYIYDALNGNYPDGSGPAWMPGFCGPSGGPGTCPDRYIAP